MDKWCKCRIVEPAYLQEGDTLVCKFCNERKDLPPKVDFNWERKKRDGLNYLKGFYTSYSRKLLIELLLNRDSLIIDLWRLIYRAYYSHGLKRDKAKQHMKDIDKLYEGFLSFSGSEERD